MPDPFNSLNQPEVSPEEKKRLLDAEIEKKQADLRACSKEQELLRTEQAKLANKKNGDFEETNARLAGLQTEIAKTEEEIRKLKESRTKL